jgi:hypothetical protein
MTKDNKPLAARVSFEDAPPCAPKTDNQVRAETAQKATARHAHSYIEAQFEQVLRKEMTDSLYSMNIASSIGDVEVVNVLITAAQVSEIGDVLLKDLREVAYPKHYIDES